MKRYLAPTALAAALAAVMVSASGCNANWTSTSAPAASVNGQTVVSVSSLKAVIGAVKKDAGFLCLNVGPKPQITGVGTDTYSMTFTDEVLTLLVKYGVTTTEAKALHLYMPASKQFTALASQQVVDGDNAALSDLEQEGVNGCATGAQIVAGEGADMRSAQLQSQVAEDALAAHLAGISLRASQLASYEASHPALTISSCVEVLEVTSAQNKDTVESKLRAGQSWDALVTKYSKAQGLGADGAAGCAFGFEWVGGLGPVIDGLTVDKPSGPTKLNGDYVFLRVTSRTSATQAEYLENIGTQEETAFQSTSGQLLKSAQVVIDPAYGSWSVTSSSSGITATVTPPGAKAAANAPNPAAVGVTTTTTASTVQPGT
ncbi:MAG: hypothetical protein ACRD0Z_11230 [Acidimicrobiales bacterium]